MPNDPPKLTDVNAEPIDIDAYLKDLPSPSAQAYYELGLVTGASGTPKTLDRAAMDAAFPMPNPTDTELIQSTYKIRIGGDTPKYTEEQNAAFKAALKKMLEGQAQAIETPTHRRPMTHFGYIDMINGIQFKHLDELDSFPLKNRLRTVHGAPLDLAIRELPVMAFISLMVRESGTLSGVATGLMAGWVPGWISAIAFVSDPYVRDLTPEQAASERPDFVSVEHVRFTLGYYADFTQHEVPETVLPEWLVQRGRKRPEPWSKRGLV